MTKQRILFITTGGTIASVRTQQGLKPVLTSEELLAHLPELKELCCPETLALCSIDSTDLGQEHWLMMARAIQENYALYDGFIICHGTDTLAYSAAALSYLIQNADKPIILTGAQQPISNEITDNKVTFLAVYESNEFFHCKFLLHNCLLSGLFLRVIYKRWFCHNAIESLIRSVCSKCELS